MARPFILFFIVAVQPLTLLPALGSDEYSEALESHPASPVPYPPISGESLFPAVRALVSLTAEEVRWPR